MNKSAFACALANGELEIGRMDWVRSLEDGHLACLHLPIFDSVTAWKPVLQREVAFVSRNAIHNMPTRENDCTGAVAGVETYQLVKLFCRNRKVSYET